MHDKQAVRVNIKVSHALIYLWRPVIHALFSPVQVG